MGEEIACRLLKEKGYRIIETNFRTRFGELDIIASKDNFLVFVEVKLKKGTDFGLPEEMITEASFCRSGEQPRLICSKTLLFLLSFYNIE